MRATLLGSGEATGVPVPFCDCDRCAESEPRRRPGLLVETADATVLLDAGPEVRAGLHTTGTTDLDAAFLTHWHRDHVGGIDDLAMAAPVVGFDVHLTETARGHLERERGYLLDRLDTALLAHGEPVTVGDLRVVPFPVAHGRPAFDTLGFAVYGDGSKLVYAPDVGEFLTDRDAGREFVDADLLFVEGYGVVRPDEDGYAAGVRNAVRAADADRTVLVHLNEHLAGMPTAELEAVAADFGCEVGSDYERYRP